MAQQSKTPRDHHDLLFVGTQGDLACFSAPSAHDPQRTHLVTFDPKTGDVLCSCRWCETHPHEETPRCLLALSVPFAYYAQMCRAMRPERLADLDARYTGRHPFLTADQIVRWGILGEEIQRRALALTKERGAVAKADLFDDAATEAGNVFEAAMVGAG